MTNDEAYLLGILYGKGSILNLDSKNCILKFRIKFRRPTDQSLRSDNKYTKNPERDFVESLKSKLTNDFSIIMKILNATWNIDSTIDLPNSYSLNDWGMKEITITSEKIPNNHRRICELLNCTKLTNACLLKFPFGLKIEENTELSLAFAQGICDSCSLVPNEASSSFGGKGIPRIQLEPPQERWELPIGLCRIFQMGLNIPVNNINWGHPQIRHSWKHQNHQFRVSLQCIPNYIELYRLNYKREEYHELYKRSCTSYKPTEKCPDSKRMHKGECIHINRKADLDLNSNLLDERIRGISINVSQKKSLIICKLLGCTQCENYFDVEIDD